MGALELAGRYLDVADLQTSTALLGHWVTVHYGPDAELSNVRPMHGTASVSFGFDVTTSSLTEPLLVRVAADRPLADDLVDVIHQVPVLRAARLHNVPTPAVRWWSDDERWFAQPYFVMKRLPGNSLNPWAPSTLKPSDVQIVFDQAVSALAAIHRIDWRRLLTDWSTPRSLTDEVRGWVPMLLRGRDDARTAIAMKLHDLLLDRMPDQQPRPTVVHRDFYSDNWVHAEGRLLGVVDWELAGIGAPLGDLAWMMNFQDTQCWGPSGPHLITCGPSPSELAEAYEAASGRLLTDLSWYRALAIWRLVAGSALMVRLHRSGRRVDPAWAMLDEAFDRLVDRGCEFLLSDAATL
jgi:aminoglycoside phosphotransferase (APT) family kinase protein